MPITKKSRKKKRKGHYHRGEYTSSKTGQVCKYRSGWEHNVMQYLDNNPDVVSWSYEKTVIEYISNIRTKKTRKYYPDFFVKYKNEKVEIIEVKPKRKLQQAIIKKKTSAAEQWCMTNGATYRILTEIELKELGLL
jgi:hypothetical protein